MSRVMGQMKHRWVSVRVRAWSDGSVNGQITGRRLDGRIRTGSSLQADGSDYLIKAELTHNCFCNGKSKTCKKKGNHGKHEWSTTKKSQSQY